MTTSSLGIRLQSVYMAYRDIDRGGSSDKVYHIHLDEVAGTYTIVTEYGRRGSTLVTNIVGCTNSRREADDLFAKQISKKQNHWTTPYTIVRDTRSLATSTERPLSVAATVASSHVVTANDYPTTDVRPALPQAIDTETTQALLKNDSYFMEQKIDGVRLSVRYSGSGAQYGNVAYSNKLGRGIAAPSEQLAAAMQQLGKISDSPAGLTLDGEYLEGKLYVFDVLERRGVRLEEMTFEMRLAIREGLEARYRNDIILNRTSSDNEILRFLPVARTTAEKTQLFESLHQGRAEGVVFKQADGVYRAGKTNAQVKYKFYETMDCLVRPVSGKRSLDCYVYPESGRGRLIHLGAVTAPTDAVYRQAVEAATRQENLIAEVRYLYLSGAPGHERTSGKLVQPVWLRYRSDASMTECTAAGLKTADKTVRRECNMIAESDD